MPVYLVLQYMGCAAPHVAMQTGGLLHHLFTLTLPWRGPYDEERLFSVTLPGCRHPLSVRKHAVLHCPDFPLHIPDVKRQTLSLPKFFCLVAVLHTFDATPFSEEQPLSACRTFYITSLRTLLLPQCLLPLRASDHSLSSMMRTMESTM